ncbi:hypothetical protein RB195_003807 [Necator americanus]|uniref:Uncharacterized protein n=1 Tax=Necator americanus TaxID=51031 RepID=A0ABR1DRS7_NECAM
MRRRSVFGLLFLFGLSRFASSSAKLKDMESLAMSKKELERVQQLHYGWNNRRAFVACLDSIEKEHDVRSGAKCLVKAFDKKLVTSYPYALHRSYYDFVGEDLKRPRNVKKRKLIRKVVKDFAKSRAFKLLKLNSTTKSKLFKKSSRKKIHKTSRKRKRTNGYSKRIQKKDRQHKTIKLRKRKQLEKKLLRSPNMARRLKRNVLSLFRNKETIEEAKRIDRMDMPYQPRNMKSLPSLITQERTPAKVITDFLGSIWRAVKNQTNGVKLHSSYMKLQQLQNKVTEMKREGQFKQRMLDMVVGKNNPLRKKKSFTERQDDTGNSVLPIPEVLEKSGLNPKDRDSILELVMDVAGVNSVVEKSMDLLRNVGRSGLGGELTKITSAIDSVFEEIRNSLVVEQRKDLAGRQFAFLNKEQLTKLYGKEGILNTTLAKLPFDIDEYAAMNRAEREESLRNTIRLLASDPKRLHRRYKRTITIQFFRHTTLAPFAFAPTILTLNVLGPVTLSPSLFSPSIVSPLLLSPPVISPQVGNPLILSPYVLGPNVLSAAVFNAYVLSPYVLSPNVINPYVLSPLILSPFVLCPDVVSPTQTAIHFIGPADDS